VSLKLVEKEPCREIKKDDEQRKRHGRHTLCWVYWDDSEGRVEDSRVCGPGLEGTASFKTQPLYNEKRNGRIEFNKKNGNNTY
jgi:hypothetical protein